MIKFSPWAAAFSGVPFVFSRPLTVVAWTLLQFVILLPTVAFFAASMSGGADALGPWLLAVYFGGALAVLVLQVIAYSAAVRSLLKPEASLFAYLRFGDAERNHFSHGSAGGADTDEAPISRMIVAAVLVLLPVIVAAFAPEHPWSVLLLPVALIPAAAYGVYAAVRSSLTSAVAFYRWDARRAGWRMTKGRFWPLLAMHSTAFLIWAAAAAAILTASAYALAWWWDLPVVALPKALMAQGLPRDWREVFTPVPLALIGVASLLAALRLALCARPSAAAYKALALDHRAGRTLAERIEG